jgi:hypothetical protein
VFIGLEDQILASDLRVGTKLKMENDVNCQEEVGRFVSLYIPTNKKTFYFVIQITGVIGS